MEFGHHEAANRKHAGLGQPATFDFTHIWRKTKKGKFMVIRQTVRKRMQAKLQEVKTELRRRMHDPVPEVGEWLKPSWVGISGTSVCREIGMLWLTSASR